MLTTKIGVFCCMKIYFASLGIKMPNFSLLVLYR